MFAKYIKILRKILLSFADRPWASWQGERVSGCPTTRACGRGRGGARSGDGRASHLSADRGWPAQHTNARDRRFLTLSALPHTPGAEGTGWGRGGRQEALVVMETR